MTDWFTESQRAALRLQLNEWRLKARVEGESSPLWPKISQVHALLRGDAPPEVAPEDTYAAVMAGTQFEPTTKSVEVQARLRELEDVIRLEEDEHDRLKLMPNITVMIAGKALTMTPGGDPFRDPANGMIMDYPTLQALEVRRTLARMEIAKAEIAEHLSV